MPFAGTFDVRVKNNKPLISKNYPGFAAVLLGAALSIAGQQAARAQAQTGSDAVMERLAQAGAPARSFDIAAQPLRSEEHTSELQSLMRISYAVFCLKKKKHNTTT